MDVRTDHNGSVKPNAVEIANRARGGYGDPDCQAYLCLSGLDRSEQAFQTCGSCIRSII